MLRCLLDSSDVFHSAFWWIFSWSQKKIINNTMWLNFSTNLRIRKRNLVTFNYQPTVRVTLTFTVRGKKIVLTSVFVFGNRSERSRVVSFESRYQDRRIHNNGWFSDLQPGETSTKIGRSPIFDNVKPASQRVTLIVTISCHKLHSKRNTTTKHFS